MKKKKKNNSNNDIFKKLFMSPATKATPFCETDIIIIGARIRSKGHYSYTLTL